MAYNRDFGNHIFHIKPVLADEATFKCEIMLCCPNCGKQEIGFHINSLYCKNCKYVFTSKEGEEAWKRLNATK